MRKLLFVLIILFTTCSFNNLVFSQNKNASLEALLIIPQENFRDEEFFQTLNILKQNGIEVTVASTTLNIVKGMLGAKVSPNALINNVNARDFDAVIFIGGMGATQYYNDPLAHKLAQDALNENRIVAAICIAPVILAKAGLLQGKRATVSASEASLLRAGGAEYSAKPVQKDGNIITASGPSATREFAEEILRAVK